MSYIPDPTDATQPVSSTKASTAAEEFRALKTYIAGLAGLAPITAISALTVQELNGGPIAGLRNRVINGSFSAWQRSTSVAISVGGFGYTADRWYGNCVGGISCTTTRAKTAVGSEDLYGYHYSQWSFAGAGISGSNVGTRIENGAAVLGGKTVTLSFVAADSVATSLQVIFRQYFGTGGAPSAQVDTTPAAVTIGPSFGSKQSITVTLPSIAGKTLGTNLDDYLDIIFIPAVANAHVFSLSHVQLELGTVSTPFEQIPAAANMALCQRYYEAGNAYYEGYAGAAGASIAGENTRFAVPKRIIPTMTLGALNNILNAATGATRATYADGFERYALTIGAGALIARESWTASAEF